MLLKVLNLIVFIIFLHSCSIDPNAFQLKRSANEKLVDSVGASKNEKRRPTENNEYIRKAKRNLIEKEDEDYEDEDDDESKYNLNYSYKQMYENMIHEDRKIKSQRTVKQAPDKKIFDKYQSNIVTKPLNQTSTLENDRKAQEQLYKEIKALKSKLEALNSQSCEVKPGQKNEVKNSFGSSSGSKTSSGIKEGGACLLPEDNF